MEKRTIDVYEYAREIVQGIHTGGLLTTRTDHQTDTMTIGWGTLGVNWAKPVFAAYISRYRYTMVMLKANPEFTVNLPLGPFNKKILGICGSAHGNVVDKVEKAGLTPVESTIVAPPGFRELPLTLECRVIYQQLQDLDLYPPDILKQFYPQDVPGTATMFNKEPHYTIFGEIVHAYVIEDDTKKE